MPLRCRQLGPLLVAALAVGAAGCHWRAADSSVDWADALAPRTLEALSRQLEKDEWRPNPDWSAWPDGENQHASTLQHRWTFGTPPTVRSQTPAIAPPVDPAPADPGTDSADRAPSADSESEPEDTPASEQNAAPPSVSEATWDGFTSASPLSTLAALEHSEPLRDHHGQPIPADAYLAVLARRNDLVGWNAAILWAQRNPATASDVAPRLRTLFDNPPSDKTSQPKVSPSMQLAAAEAWCLVLAHNETDPQTALAPAGRLLERPDLADALRAELFLALAAWIPPAAIPRLENALREPDATDDPAGRAPVEIRRAAIEACVRHAAGAAHDAGGELAESSPRWPATIDSCRRDPDPRVRRLYGEWLAVTRSPDAFAILKSQLFDTDIRVREDALLNLGRLGTDEARDELRRQAARPEPRVREFAARALSRWGVGELAPLANDAAFNVRLAVADALQRFATVEAAMIARELLVDRDPQVQLAAAGAVDGWPDDLALPVLLQGMRDSSRVTRHHCQKRLRERTNLTGDFDVDASREQRLQQIAALAREGNLPLNWLDQLRRNGLREAQQIDELQAAEIRATLDDFLAHDPPSPVHLAAAERLRKLGAAELPLVEKKLETADTQQAARLYRDLLPHLDESYASIRDLESGDVFARRSAAQRLFGQAQQQSLRPLVVRRLAELLAPEQDRLVWRYAMQAIALDNSDETARIAELAANHTWPDIRLLACQYAARHGRPAHASWLLPLLHDSSKDVQLAAVEAAGHCRHPVLIDGTAPESGGTPLPGLRPLLTSADNRIRFAAVVSLTRLGDSAGMQELLRQSYHESAVTREQVVREMGASGQVRFVDHLIRMGWTESSEPVRQAILASLEQLIPPEKRPAAVGHRSASDDKIKAWMTWWQAQQTAGVSP